MAAEAKGEGVVASDIFEYIPKVIESSWDYCVEDVDSGELDGVGLGVGLAMVVSLISSISAISSTLMELAWRM